MKVTQERVYKCLIELTEVEKLHLIQALSAYLTHYSSYNASGILCKNLIKELEKKG